MDAKRFYEKFLQAIGQKRNYEGRDLFNIYKHNAEYTSVIIKIINEIIKKEGYSPQNEYFRIDAVGWTSHYQDMQKEAEAAGIDLKPHLWDLKIAVEHENDKRDWSDEVMKLIHVKCPLKVVIAYNYSDERGEKEQKKLDFLAAQMKKIEAFSIGEQKEQYLIILGNGCNHKTGKADYIDFGYKGYLYDWEDKNFKKMELSNSIASTINT